MLWERNILDALEDFDASKPTKWYVVDQRYGSGVVAKYEGDPFFCFHTINAWEGPSSSYSSHTDIVVDLSAYESLDILKKYYFEHVMLTSPTAREFMADKSASTRANLQRWRLPSLNSHTISVFGRAVLDFSVPRGIMRAIDHKFQLHQ